MAEVTFIVSDMSCSHCEATVRGALMKVDGVAAVAIDLDRKTVNVRYDTASTSEASLGEAIEDAGYEAGR